MKKTTPCLYRLLAMARGGSIIWGYLVLRPQRSGPEQINWKTLDEVGDT